MSKENQPDEQEQTEIQEQALRKELSDEIFGDGDPKQREVQDDIDQQIQDKVDSHDKSESESESDYEVDPDLDPDLEPDQKKLFAEVTKRLKALDILNQTVSSMSNRLKQAEQRIGGINNRLAEVKESKKQMPEKVQSTETPTKQQIESAAENDTAWNNLKESFPDWASAIEKKITDKSDNYVTKDEIAELRQQLTEKTQVKNPELKSPANPISDQDINIRLLNIAHPDWKMIKDSEDFTSWLKKQDVTILDKAQNSTIAEDAIDVLNLFKKEFISSKEKTQSIEDFKQKRKQRLKSSTTERTNHKENKAKSDADLTEVEIRQKAAAEIFGS